MARGYSAPFAGAGLRVKSLRKRKAISTMKNVPKDERRRLEVLWQYDILDTIPEQVFDDLTELAASICEAPIALITLVDEKRQWFKSKVGVSVTETSRDISFCGHAILHRELFIVPDAARDARFAHNPLVLTEPQIRFYAGAPLITPDGHALGTLCVIDKVPRTLRPDQKRALQILSRHVMTQLELRRHAFELARAREERDNIRNDLHKLRTELTQARKQILLHKDARAGASPVARLRQRPRPRQ
jgi:GAF domain-containing protein